MKEMLNNLLNESFDFLVGLVIAIIVLIVGFKVVKLLEKALRKEHKFAKLEETAKEFLISVIIIALKILLFVIAATIIGIPTTSLITIIGSCALAIGLALQGGLSNLAGGLMILIFKPFKLGDFIKTSEFEGTVKSISMFYTSLTTLDNKVVQLPNGNLSNTQIVNYSVNPIRRLDIELSVGYKIKIDRVKKVLYSVIEKNEYVLQDKDNIIRLDKHGDSALIFAVKVWVNNSDYQNAKFSLMEETKEAFDRNNIDIPYPQIDVHKI